MSNNLRGWFQGLLRPLTGSPAWLVCAWLWLGSALGVLAQSSITNGCFVASYLPERTNLVCGAYEFAESGVVISNRCPEDTLPKHSVLCEPPLGSLLEAGEHPVTCRALVKEEIIAECQFRIVVQVVTGPPVMVCSQDRVSTIPCGRTNFPAGYPAPSVANGALMWCDPPPGGRQYPVGTNKVTCIATNLCGLQTECSFNVTLIAEVMPPPIITPPTYAGGGPIMCNQPCAPINYPMPTVTGGGYPLVCSPPPGTCFPPGYSTVTCRATNYCSAWSETSFRVTVSRDNFSSGPYFPDYNSANEGEWSLGTFTNRCRSNCLPVRYPLPTIQLGWLAWCNPPPGSCFPVGTNVISCRATNHCEYAVASTTFRVIVVQGPTLPYVLRMTGTDATHALDWEERCPGEAVLQKADDPDGPWTPLPDARPGFAVTPTERRQYFRLVVE